MSQLLNILLPIFGVIIGAFLTYNLNSAMEKKNRKYELKKLAYLDLLNVLIEAEKELENFKKFLLSGGSKEDYDKNIDYIISSIEFKFLLSGGSQEVYDVVDKKILITHVFEDHDKVSKIIREELIPVMKKDLNIVETGGWQFWR